MITDGYLSPILRTTPMKTSNAFSYIHHVNPAILVPFVQVNKIWGSYSSTFLCFPPKWDGWWSGSSPIQEQLYSKTLLIVNRYSLLTLLDRGIRPGRKWWQKALKVSSFFWVTGQSKWLIATLGAPSNPKEERS
jgi:hypothetical protein